MGDFHRPKEFILDDFSLKGDPQMTAGHFPFRALDYMEEEE
jgi:hypothetical protein